MELKQALQELRKEEKRKFEQSIDLIINLKGIDLRKETISALVNLPHPIKIKKVCAFLTKKSALVPTVTSADFPKYKDKKALKELAKDYDFFIGFAGLMPAVATTFGKILGPIGKMPSPQLGILAKEDDASIKHLLDRMSTALKIRLREPSMKVSVGKENMKDEQIEANIRAVYTGLLAVLPTKKENVKNILLKTTMGKPLKVEL